MRVSTGLAPACPAMQPDIVFSQANPVQNTWYTVMDTTPNVRLIRVGLYVDVVGENIELRITADATVLLASEPESAGVHVYATFYADQQDALELTSSLAQILNPFLLEARSLKIEIRKTTALGNGTLHVNVKWARF